MRLLVIEDNRELSGLLLEELEKAGFTVDCFRLADEAIAAVAIAQYSAVVLDLGLPDSDGMEVLAALRDRGDSTPVLILTARDGLEDRVKGLNRGADDYVLKPFEMEELIARVKALLRRPGGALGVTLNVGNVTFDTITRVVSVAGKDISLSPRELSLLENLMRSARRVVTKAALEENLYGFNEQVTSNSVEVAVHRLRKKLTSVGAKITIHTLRGVGYLMSTSQADATVEGI